MSQNNPTRQSSKRGFTLVELMIAMAFIAVLLIMIATVVIMTSRIYTQGITIRTVNQEGRLLVEDMRRTMSQAVTIPARNIITSHADYGILCTGKYTYLWSYGKTFRPDGSSTSPLKYTLDPGSPTVVFAKVNDTDAMVCENWHKDRGALPSLSKNTSFSLLDNGDRELAIHRADISGSEQLGIYHLVLTIGTNDPTTIQYNTSSGTAPGTIGQLGGQCRPPSDSDGQEDYCAVNVFDFVVRTGSDK